MGLSTALISVCGVGFCVGLVFNDVGKGVGVDVFRHGTPTHDGVDVLGNIGGWGGGGTSILGDLFFVQYSAEFPAQPTSCPLGSLYITGDYSSHTHTYPMRVDHPHRARSYPPE